MSSEQVSILYSIPLQTIPNQANKWIALNLYKHRSYWAGNERASFGRMDDSRFIFHSSSRPNEERRASCSCSFPLLVSHRSRSLVIPYLFIYVPSLGQNLIWGAICEQVAKQSLNCAGEGSAIIISSSYISSILSRSAARKLLHLLPSSVPPKQNTTTTATKTSSSIIKTISPY